MKNKCQHLTEQQCNSLLKLLQKFERLLYGALGNCKIYAVDLKLK